MNQVSLMHFQNMIHRGAKHLISYEKDLNAINVFPVPDGDTGSNLAYLMNMILLKQPRQHSQLALEQLKLACLQGSRGNSGMIFSQFIIAMCDFIADKTQLTREQFVEMCEFGVKKTYQAVHHPLEGTVLSVMHDWVNGLKTYKQRSTTIPELLSLALKDALNSLEKTKVIREECRKKNVVDAGAKGFCYFLQGFIEGLTSKHDKASVDYDNLPTQDLNFELEHKFSEDHHEHDLTYRYCTEFIIYNVQDDARLKDKLTCFGDSLVFISSQSYCKVHIHTNTPHDIAHLLHDEGQIMYQKVEDMYGQQRMMVKDKPSVAIVVDSACDLPQSFFDDYHVYMLPLAISVNESHYLDKLTLTSDQLYQYMKEGKTEVTSSQPNREQILRLYNQLLEHYEHIVSIHVSSQLSGTYATCKQVASEIKNQSIHVIDSKTLSGAYGLIVKQLVEYVEARKKVEINLLKHYMEHLINSNKIYVTVPSLESMVNSGRVSKTTGKLAELVKLKPIVTIDQSGKSKLLSPTLFRKSSIPHLIKQIKQLQHAIKIDEYVILYTDETKELHLLEQQMIALTGKKPSYITTVSSVIGKYAGSGAYSIALTMK